MRESMPLLLTEALDAGRRELTHQHIESCDACGAEWRAYKDTWMLMGDLPEVEVPARVKQQFLSQIGIAPQVRETVRDNVVPFHKRPAFKWVAQAAGVALLVGGGYFAGNRQSTIQVQSQQATIERLPSAYTPVSANSMALAETRVVDAGSLSPEIQGRPNITNVQFVDGDASDDHIGVAFDVTSRWTVTGNPRDKSMVRLLSYMLENEESMTPRSSAMEWVRRTYSDPANANPEIANALAKVLRNEEHEGVRIRAVDTLTNLPPAVATQTQTRDALIEALKSDPNPAVRLKAVEALVNMAASGVRLDPAMVDTLRAKATQDDENLYVRVKAAEALSKIR
ncbi:MAG: HEAT repeat domain-containing protein [Acidobacteriota bacterium]|nr:HEAT repeat domain-containing protein [Acidobacteriota bacterium]